MCLFWQIRKHAAKNWRALCRIIFWRTLVWMEATTWQWASLCSWNALSICNFRKTTMAWMNSITSTQFFAIPGSSTSLNFSIVVEVNQPSLAIAQRQIIHYFLNLTLRMTLSRPSKNVSILLFSFGNGYGSLTSNGIICRLTLAK